MAEQGALPVIDGYENFELIGHGGFSRVYKAHQINIGRDVAIKVLTLQLTSDTDRRRFERECKAMGALSQHPNIVTINDRAFTKDGFPAIVMAYYSGVSYWERIKTRQTFTLEELVTVGTKIASALEHAHTNGVFHRDVKPQNILLSEFGEPALGDFGIATIDEERTATAAASLTFHYAPPEVLEQGHVGAPSDIYSLAATIYTMAALKQPFASSTETRSLAMTMRAILLDDAPALDPQLYPEALDTVLRQAMSKNLADRPQTANEFAQQLQTLHGATDIEHTQIRPTPHPVAPVIQDDITDPTPDLDLTRIVQKSEEPAADSHNIVWTRIPDTKGIFGDNEPKIMHGVTAFSTGFVAVGESGLDAAVWTSITGYDWSRVADSGSTFDRDDRQRMLSIVAAGPGLVAVGETVTDGKSSAAAWVSHNAQDWVRVPDEASEFEGLEDQIMTGVATDGTAIVAVGGNGDQAGVWLSQNGVTWTRVLDEHGELGASATDPVGMSAVTAGGPGFVAVGKAYGYDDSDAAVWVSEDGKTWDRIYAGVDAFGGLGEQEMLGVTSCGRGLIAVGNDVESDDASVWISPNGLSWVRVLDEPCSLGGESFRILSDVTSVGQTIVAVGMDIDDDDGAAVWTSTDNILWSRDPNADGVLSGESKGLELSQEMLAVATGPNSVIAVGSEIGTTQHAAVWIAPL